MSYINISLNSALLVGPVAIAANNPWIQSGSAPLGGRGGLETYEAFFKESVLGEASNARLAGYGRPSLSSARSEPLLEELCALARE